MRIYLYTTAGCHLCDLARAIVWPLLVKHDFRLLEIEIADDDDLISRYGVRIPVLASSMTARELNWPFTVSDIEAFFSDLASL
ncbi:MAG TPA: glutaredoxin family protein [Cellvibrio sp.]|nr:glutaredoxin family protein [Cellvibrio sp.]